MQRDWRILVEEYREDYEQASVEALVECHSLLKRMGGAITVMAIRSQDEDEFEPLGLHFRYDSFAPAIRKKPAVVEPVESAAA